MYYLARWVEKDSNPDELDIRPDVPDGSSFAAIDLRGSNAAQTGSAVGYCLVDSQGEEWADRPGRLWRVADDHTAKSRVLRRRLSNLLGFNFDTDASVGNLLLEWYLNGDEAQGSKPNPLAVNSRRQSYRIRLGGTTMAEIPALAGGAVLTDNYNRANGAIGANWTKTSTSGDFIVLDNQAESNGTVVAYYAYNNGTAATDAQYCQVKIAQVGANQFGPQVRMLNSYANSSGYMAYWQGANDDFGRIRYTDTNAAPSRTTLTESTIMYSVADDAVIRIEVDGSALTWWHDGTEWSSLATTDTTYAASSTRRTGGMYSYQHGVAWDDWGFGDLDTGLGLGGDLAADVTVTGDLDRTANLTTGNIATTNTLTGDANIIKVLSGGEIAIDVTIVGDGLDSIAFMEGQDITVMVSVNGGMDVVTSDLGGLTSVDVTLTAEAQVATYLAGGDIVSTATMTGVMGSTPLAKPGEEATVNTFVTFSGAGPLTKAVKLGGDVPVGSSLTLGAPITKAKYWNGVSWVPCWITVKVPGDWKQGQLKIWDGAAWQG